MSEQPGKHEAESNNSNGERILILAPTGRDAEMARAVLGGAGMDCHPCLHIQDVCDELKRGAAAILIADETLNNAAVNHLLNALDKQPAWSDVPVVVFPTNAGNAALLLERLGSLANVTILERPVRIAYLLNAVKGALRARRRQYQARDLLLQLENADRQKDLFLAMLSHELRTPLSAILGWCRILDRGTVDEQTKARALEVIHRNATAQEQLIADILSVSQIVAGTMQIEMAPVELDGIIRSSIESIRPSAEARNIEIVYRAQRTGATTLGDVRRLQQVVSNLLSNSVKFTQIGGLIEVELAESASEAQIIVRDNGKGIAPEFLPYVFDRFRQGDSSSTRSQGGLGLGLAIVRHLVEMHRGTIRGESPGQNQGATFTISLPVDAAVEQGRLPDLTSSERS